MGAGVLTELRDPFPRKEGSLHCGPVPVREAAERFGTPLYLYSWEGIEERYRVLDGAFREVEHRIAFSVKANGNPALLVRLASLGAWADVVSGGELHLALRGGVPPERIVFAGVGKTREELEAGLRAGIHAFHVESGGELRLLERVAREAGRRAPFALRVNPDIVSPTPWEYTRTGHLEAKFGVPLEEARELYRWAAGREALVPRGIDVHIGSQIADPEPYGEALTAVMELEAGLREDGTGVEYVDVGGGFAVGYEGERAMDPGALAATLVPLLRGRGLALVLEPGRFLVADSGILLTRVLYVKRTPRKCFVVVDAGMTELLRPSHYGGRHRIEPVEGRGDRAPERVDVVGPVCETGDFLARDYPLPLPEPGELLAVRTAGAYGYAMASNYNGRLRPAEVLVEGGEARLIRERERLEDLVRGVILPAGAGEEP